MSENNRVLVIGNSGKACLYAALLHKVGWHVEMVAFDSCRDMRDNGVVIDSVLGELSFRPQKVYASTREAPATDWVIVAVKMLPDVPFRELLSPVLKPSSTLCLIANGLDVECPIAEAFPRNPLISCAAYVASIRGESGRIEHTAGGDLIMGSYPNGAGAECKYLAEAFRQAGVEASLTLGIVAERWKKVVWNATFNPLSVLANGVDTGRLLATPEAERLARTMMTEVISTARAEGYLIADSVIDDNIAITKQMPPYCTSMAVDYLKGHPIESEAVVGSVVRYADRHGIAIPCLRTAYELLRMGGDRRVGESQPPRNLNLNEDKKMSNLGKFYINGAWVTPSSQSRPFSVINPATEQREGEIFMADRADVDKAIQAARDAFDSFSQTSLEQRRQLLERFIGIYERRLGDMASAISREMGAPLHTLASQMQAPLGLIHAKTTLEAAQKFPFERRFGGAMVYREPVGVCALITPWNWPMNQVMCKVAPALLAGCTVVLKPSEFAPLSAQILAEIIDETGLPAGVFNMIHGDGAEIGPMLSSDPRVDMVSLTGSTRAGASVSKEAADTFKRVSLELGGKSANIILPDADLEVAVSNGAQTMLLNSGQSCNAPSRMLVQKDQLQQAEAIAAKVFEATRVADPSQQDTDIGPIANARQFQRVQSYIEKGIAEGAKLVCGGPGKPEGVDKGYFARPTIFSNVSNDMTIAREEIFGPVLVMIPYTDVEDAVRIANDTEYGLSGYVFGATEEAATAIAKRLRTGMVHVNGGPLELETPPPFGGYKHSGIGREWGEYGLEEFLESKSVFLAG